MKTFKDIKIKVKYVQARNNVRKMINRAFGNLRSSYGFEYKD